MQARTGDIRATPLSRYVECEGREIHYVEWGNSTAPPVLMWHGLARTARDFDDLSAELATDYRVLCPDMIGRGFSAWSSAPDQEYCLDFYVRVARALADYAGVERFRWVGTSMGGAIGMRAGATTLKGRISHLVLNDIGASIHETSGYERIIAYVGNPPAFPTMTAFENYLREVYRPYGWLSDVQWRRMAESSARRLPDGRITTHYDPNIVRQYVSHPNDYQQWEHYDVLRMPALLLRGAGSDLLPREIAEEMTRRGPRAELIEVPGCGHAPALNVPDQINIIRRFLAEGHV